MQKTGSAVWQGALRDGKGMVSTQSGALKDQPYGFATRFEDKPGTNPEELIGAAHASCFAMALSNILGDHKVVPEEIRATSAITLDPDGDSFKVTRAHLTVTIRADAEEATLMEAAEAAKANCPISKLLNTEITMEASVG